MLGLTYSYPPRLLSIATTGDSSHAFPSHETSWALASQPDPDMAFKCLPREGFIKISFLVIFILEKEIIMKLGLFNSPYEVSMTMDPFLWCAHLFPKLGTFLGHHSQYIACKIRGKRAKDIQYLKVCFEWGAAQRCPDWLTSGFYGAHWPWKMLFFLPGAWREKKPCN